MFDFLFSGGSKDIVRNVWFSVFSGGSKGSIGMKRVEKYLETELIHLNHQPVKPLLAKLAGLRRLLLNTWVDD